MIKSQNPCCNLGWIVFKYLKCGSRATVKSLRRHNVGVSKQMFAFGPSSTAMGKVFGNVPTEIPLILHFHGLWDFCD